MTEPSPYSWPFNPNFPQVFSFPAFGTAEWLALALWRDCKGDATIRIKADVIRNWQTKWFWIYELNHLAADCRFLKQIHFADADAAQVLALTGGRERPLKPR